ncbi:MAG TPA: ABC transporter permease [Firmicutes bacterium]|nr:ABC transporter permease [Bacillota bacterium]
MLRYVLRRFFSIILVLWVVATGTFILMHAIPGGPFTTEKQLPPGIMKNIEERYHLNDPLWKQYLDYMKGIVTWNLGPSFKYEGRTVNDIINEGFPVSAQLGALAIIAALVLGIPLGVIAALNRGKWVDNFVMVLGTIGYSVPSFIMATLLMVVFAVWLRWLPAAMWGTWKQAIMPTICLMFLPMAFIARMTRSSMIEVLEQDYIRTARAKGLSERAVIYRHALKNAIMPVVSWVGPLAAGLLTGTFVVEFIFAIPGLGRHFTTSIYNRDYTVIMGTTVFYSIWLVLFNFVVDILYGFLDPRIKYVDERG